MCTSFIKKKKLNLSESEQKIVSQLGEYVASFLTKCKNNGTVIIMTNSNESWVRSTSTDYLKIDREIFKDIYIISTRDIFANQNIKKKNWKKLLEKYKINITN